jgi:hypothetical protein
MRALSEIAAPSRLATQWAVELVIDVRKGCNLHFSLHSIFGIGATTSMGAKLGTCWQGQHNGGGNRGRHFICSLK